MWPFRKKDPIEAFWAWFVKHEAKLFAADGPGLEASGIEKKLRAVHDALVWEFGPPSESPREFIISADGVKEAFTAVETLADAAPPLPRWKVVRFRPRMARYAEFELHFGEVKLGAKDLEVILMSNGVMLGVRVYVRGCTEADEPKFARAVFVMLDGCLGEYDVECKIGAIKVLPFEEDAGEDRVPWADFREAFDAAFEGLHRGKGA